MKKLLLILILSGLSSSIIFGMDKQEEQEQSIIDFPQEIIERIIKKVGSGSDYLSKVKTILPFALTNKSNMESAIYWLSHPEVVGDDPQKILQSLFDSGELIGIAKKALIKAGANLAQVKIQNPQAQLFKLIDKGKMSSLVLKFLIDAGADVNAKNHWSWTALMLASINDHKEIVKMLIDNNADVNAKNDFGMAALMWASEGHKEIVKMLIDNNADVNAQDKDGWTVLMKASMNGHKEIVELLINSKADVNAQDKDGWTALMRASIVRGCKEIVELLEKAEKSAENKNINCNN